MKSGLSTIFSKEKLVIDNIFQREVDYRKEKLIIDQIFWRKIGYRQPFLKKSCLTTAFSKKKVVYR